MCLPVVSSGDSQHVRVALEEYRALYGLVIYRMTSLDRRIPAVGGALAAFLGSVAVLPPEGRFVFLLAIPLAAVWYVRTTVNHARSFEDVLRRIAELERTINAAVGCSIVRFQSQHPSSGRAVGGRTGAETTMAVYVTSMTLLTACVYLFAALVAQSFAQYIAYSTYVLCVAVHLLCCRRRLRQYKYTRPLVLE
jgi:hypothetical protein